MRLGISAEPQLTVIYVSVSKLSIVRSIASPAQHRTIDTPGGHAKLGGFCSKPKASLRNGIVVTPDVRTRINKATERQPLKCLTENRAASLRGILSRGISREAHCRKASVIPSCLGHRPFASP